MPEWEGHVQAWSAGWPLTSGRSPRYSTYTPHTPAFQRRNTLSVQDDVEGRPTMGEPPSGTGSATSRTVSLHGTFSGAGTHWAI